MNIFSDSSITTKAKFNCLIRLSIKVFLVSLYAVASSSHALEHVSDRGISIDFAEYEWNRTTETLYVHVINATKLVWQLQITTATNVRAEIFDPSNGSIISNATVRLDDGYSSFHFSLPQYLAYDKILLIAIDSSGVKRELRRIDRALFKTNLLASRPAANPRYASEVSLSMRMPSLSTILDNGPSENRIDILLLGDGYTESELSQWEIDAEAAMNSILSEPPFSDYKSYFNVHRANVVSNDSGISHPEIGEEKDTAFGTYYNCSNIKRLICIGDFNNALSLIYSLVDVGQEDMIVLIVNDAEYGGSGGKIAVASKNGFASEIVLHELGHSFGNLADEYDGPLPTTPTDCDEITSTNQANVSAFADFDNIKWKHWIDTVSSIPTPYTIDTGDPGFYAGAKYCRGLYRPTPNSKMRRLGRPFDSVNEEALILRMYDFVSPVDYHSPTSDVVSVGVGQLFNFEVGALAPATHELEIHWYSDGKPLASGPSLSSSLLDANAESVRVVVTDNTNKVKNDSSNKLVFEKSWKIDTSAISPAVARFENGSAYLPYVRVDNDQSIYGVELAHIPGTVAQFVLTAAEPRSPVNSSEISASFGLDNLLVMDRIEVGGTQYKVTLSLVQSEPNVVFQLESAEEV